MALRKLELAPDQEGYTAKDGESVLSAELNGGASRYRRDILNANSFLNVKWTLGPDEFSTLKNFFLYVTDGGALPFLIDLYMDEEVLTEHTARFMPSSFGIISQQGLRWVVGAQLEVEPIIKTQAEIDLDVASVVLFGELGQEYESLFPPLETIIDDVINIEFPQDLS